MSELVTRVHAIPADDVIAHEANEGCICGPEAEFVPGGVVFGHHALDGREEQESDA